MDGLLGGFLLDFCFVHLRMIYCFRFSPVRRCFRTSILCVTPFLRKRIGQISKQKVKENTTVFV